MNKAKARQHVAAAAKRSGRLMDEQQWRAVQAHPLWDEFVGSEDNEWAGDEAELLLDRIRS